ncbi:glycosyltransferase family 2 protein [Sessilibacter sp. MAH2]
MYKSHFISVIIPVLDEESAIGLVVEELLALKNPDDSLLIDEIIVCDNGSVDNSTQVAINAGAFVVHQPEKGYGAACLKAMEYLNAESSIVLFIDGDHSCVSAQSVPLITTLIDHEQDLVIGTRVKGKISKGALTPPQLFGNQLATFLIRLLWKANITDLGPFRAIRKQSLNTLKMRDRSFGWTVEMQVKAIQMGFSIEEIPVDSLKRIGKSKISGTLSGVIGAGKGILGMIFNLWWAENITKDEIYMKRSEKS